MRLHMLLHPRLITVIRIHLWHPGVILCDYNVSTMLYGDGRGRDVTKSKA